VGSGEARSRPSAIGMTQRERLRSGRLGSSPVLRVSHRSLSELTRLSRVGMISGRVICAERAAGLRNIARAVVVIAGACGALAELTPTAGADPLPDCSMVAKGVQPDWDWDCRTQAKDKSGLVFEGRRWSIKRYVDGFERSRLDEVRISGTGVSQVVNEDIGVEDGLPFALQDLDGDGRDELLIPLGPRRGMDVDEPANYQWPCGAQIAAPGSSSASGSCVGQAFAAPKTDTSWCSNAAWAPRARSSSTNSSPTTRIRRN
jgi:hypothetical protein